MLVCLIASENFLTGDSSADDRSDEDKERPRLPRLRIAGAMPKLQDTASLSPKAAAIRDPRAKECCSAIAFRVQLTFLNASCSERALKSKGAAVELALPAAARAKER